MKIGLISDTHGHLPGKVHDAFKTVDLILHAGDIGSQDIINELETIAPVYAVHGNIDGWPLRKIYPSNMDLELEGMQVRITHNIVSYEYYTFELFRQGKHPDLVVFGHTHKSIFETYRGITFLNPGSVYRPKGGTKKGVVVIAALKSDFEPRFISWD